MTSVVIFFGGGKIRKNLSLTSIENRHRIRIENRHRIRIEKAGNNFTRRILI